MPLPTIRIQFLSGDAKLKEVEAYSWEGDFFVAGERSGEEFDENFERKKLEGEFRCPVSINYVFLPSASCAPVSRKRKMRQSWWHRLARRLLAFVFNF